MIDPFIQSMVKSLQNIKALGAGLDWTGYLSTKCLNCQLRAVPAPQVKICATWVKGLQYSWLPFPKSIKCSINRPFSQQTL